MVALITLSHGSRHPKVTAAVEELTLNAATRLAAPAHAAYLDFNTPDLPTLCRALANQGEQRAIVVPLLFTQAYHHTNDVPQACRQASVESGMHLIPAHNLGLDAMVQRIVGQRIRAQAPAGAEIVLYFVGSSSPHANNAVQVFGEHLSRSTGRVVHVLPATGQTTLRGSQGLHALSASNATKARRLHVIPLFVAPGLLLDTLIQAVPRIQDATGVRITHSPPLGDALGPVVAARYHHALRAMLTPTL